MYNGGSGGIMTYTALKISKSGWDGATDAYSNIINSNIINLFGLSSFGINLFGSINNTIYSNTITANANNSVGINFQSSSDLNNVSGNIITTKGTDNASYVVSFESSGGRGSSVNNTFYN